MDRDRRRDIAAELARGRVVEDMVLRITQGGSATSLNANGEDLAQMVYGIILEYDEAKIADLYDHGQIRYFIARVIMTQAFSPRSSFYYTIRRFSARTEDITGKEFAGV